MIRYYLHDGRTFIVPYYATPAELADMFKQAGSMARKAMTEAGAAHAIYGTKSYDRETGELEEADIYAPAVVLDDAEFDRRTAEHSKDHPGDMILAVHAMPGEGAGA